MNKTWTRIVIVVIAAAAVAFWVFSTGSAPEQQMDNALNAMPAWQVIKEQGRAASAHPRPDGRPAKSGRAGTTDYRHHQPQILHLQMTRLQKRPRTPTW